jgi:hypothetical protein
VESDVQFLLHLDDLSGLQCSANNRGQAMTNEAPAVLSRRAALRKLASTAGGAAIAVTFVGVNRATADAPAKMAQKAVAYQPTPHQGQACVTCSQFEPPSACKVVEGTISAAGWCQLYVKKS